MIRPSPELQAAIGELAESHAYGIAAAFEMIAKEAKDHPLFTPSAALGAVCSATAMALLMIADRMAENPQRAAGQMADLIAIQVKEATPRVQA